MAKLTANDKKLINQKKEAKKDLAMLKEIMSKCETDIDRDLYATGIETQEKFLELIEYQLRDAGLYEYLDKPTNKTKEELIRQEAIEKSIAESRKKNKIKKNANKKVNKFIQENEIPTMSIQPKVLSLFYDGFELGTLEQLDNKYLFKANADQTKEAIKQNPLKMSLYKLVKRGKKVYEQIPEPFAGYLPCTSRADIVKQAGIEKSDSDFEKLYKVAQLKFEDNFKIKRKF